MSELALGQSSNLESTADAGISRAEKKYFACSALWTISLAFYYTTKANKMIRILALY